MKINLKGYVSKQHMKINFKGYVSKQEILENLAKTLNTLEDAGVNNYAGVEVYLSPQKNDQEALVILDGEITESPTVTFFNSNNHTEHLQQYAQDHLPSYPKIDLNSRLTTDKTIQITTNTKT
ncbi:hypothetical protein [Photobacterium leiognathi]|uniref:hypothetical protein n=1 Tax=Photobacterium leiognathi TaxID=553611 RepID=UPI0029825658|nr:hypothetical protein [Photobacterium leiognathi]